MKTYRLQYSYEASKDLLRLDKAIARRIAQKIKSLTDSPEPLSTAKSLSGNLSGLFRYRIGDYRAIFEMNDKGIITILTILTIKHRKDIYQKDV